MTNVWVVEQGEYSDYRVVGVFSTKENAELVAAKINGGEEEYRCYNATVAEWPMDPAVDALNAGLVQWRVLMLRDGGTEEVRRLEDFYAYDLGGSFRVWERTKAPACRGKGIRDALDATVWASDEQHAVKIVNEKRAQMIAGGEWA